MAGLSTPTRWALGAELAQRLGQLDRARTLLARVDATAWRHPDTQRLRQAVAADEATARRTAGSQTTR